MTSVFGAYGPKDRALLSVYQGRLRTMNSDISTHNVEQLAERNGTAYGALEEEQEETKTQECPEPPPLKHHNVFTRALSEGTNVVERRLSKMIQAVERTNSFKTLKAKTLPLVERHVEPVIFTGHFNTSLTSENLEEPLNKSVATIHRLSQKATTLLGKVESSLSSKWKSATQREASDEYSTMVTQHGCGNGNGNETTSSVI